MGKLSLGWPWWYPEPSFPKAPSVLLSQPKHPQAQETPPPVQDWPQALLLQHPRPPPPSNVKASFSCFLSTHSPPYSLFSPFVLPSLPESDVFPERQCKGTVGIHTQICIFRNYPAIRVCEDKHRSLI